MNVHSNSINKHQKLEQPKCPSTIKLEYKHWCILSMEYYLAIKKKNELVIHKVSMNLKGITWSKRNQSQKDTYCIIYLTFSNDNMIVMEKRSVFVKGYGGGGVDYKG